MRNSDAILIEMLRRSKGEDDCYSRLDKVSSTITIVGEITPKIASDFRQQLRTLERLKKTNTITVEINTPGGDIEAGFMMVDSIELCAKSVTTRVTGNAFSMGSLILASGHTREALPNSSVMIHQGTYTFRTVHDELRNEQAECERIEKLCNDFLDAKTGQPSGYWEKRHGGKNLYLTAQQALDEKLIHTIVKRKA